MLAKFLSANPLPLSPLSQVSGCSYFRLHSCPSQEPNHGLWLTGRFVLPKVCTFNRFLLSPSPSLPSLPISLSPHPPVVAFPRPLKVGSQRLRGVTLHEIERTLNEGWEAADAKPGTLGKVLVFTYHAEWEGKFYEEKEVTVYYKIVDEQIVLLTVKARYGKGFVR